MLIAGKAWWEDWIQLSSRKSSKWYAIDDDWDHSDEREHEHEQRGEDRQVGLSEDVPHHRPRSVHLARGGLVEQRKQTEHCEQ